MTPGAVVERIEVGLPLDPYLSLKALVAYSGFSRRTLLGFMAQANALPHYRLSAGGKIVVRRSEFDAWMSQHRRTQSRLDEFIDQRRRARTALRNVTP